VSFFASLTVAQESGFGGGGTWDRSFLGIDFDRRVDVGTFLTFITLAAGFIGWGIATYRERRRQRIEEAKSGALRLLLRLLRDHGEGAYNVGVLRRDFESPELKARRIAYCGRDFKFKGDEEFEAAIYRLDWEGKIDFVHLPDEIAFRVDHFRPLERPPFPLGKEEVIEALRHALADPEMERFDLESIARVAFRVAPSEAAALIREHGEKSKDDRTETKRLLLVLERAGGEWRASV
jgi:hypothetical protein